MFNAHAAQCIPDTAMTFFMDKTPLNPRSRHRLLGARISSHAVHILFVLLSAVAAAKLLAFVGERHSAQPAAFPEFAEHSLVANRTIQTIH
jgi:hypothetical protein